MDELKSLIEALEQYSKIEAKKYKAKLKEKDVSISKLKQEIESSIKKYRWGISQGKNQDKEYMRHFEKYFIDREVI